MAKIECQFMELGKGLFLAGTNFGDKLQPKTSKGSLKILWDEEQRRAEIHGKGIVTYVTEAFVFSFEPIQDKKLEVVTHKNHPIASGVAAKAQIGGPNDVFTAQVSTPQSQVQRRAGKPPKYQGEDPGE